MALYDNSKEMPRLWLLLLCSLKLFSPSDILMINSKRTTINLHAIFLRNKFSKTGTDPRPCSAEYTLNCFTPTSGWMAWQQGSSSNNHVNIQAVWKRTANLTSTPLWWKYWYFISTIKILLWHLSTWILFFFFISFTPLSNSDTVLYQIAGDKIQAASAFIFLLWQSCNCKPTMILLCFDDLELFHKNRIYK